MKTGGLVTKNVYQKYFKLTYRPIQYISSKAKVLDVTHNLDQ